MLLQASPVVSPSFHFSLFWNEPSTLWFYAASQGACFVPNVSLLSPSLAFILVLSTLLLALTPPQLYTHDALYHHLVHIGDCHCHLLIITVTCTLRSAINTWRYQWRAAAPQRLFRPPQSWWERELAAKRAERESQCNTQGIHCSMMCLFTNLQLTPGEKSVPVSGFRPTNRIHCHTDFATSLVCHYRHDFQVKSQRVSHSHVYTSKSLTFACTGNPSVLIYSISMINTSLQIFIIGSGNHKNIIV